MLPSRRACRDFLSARFSARFARAAHAVEELIRLVRRRPVTGGDIFDLQILAIMNVNGIPRIYTFKSSRVST